MASPLGRALAQTILKGRPRPATDPGSQPALPAQRQSTARPHQTAASTPLTVRPRPPRCGLRLGLVAAEVPAASLAPTRRPPCPGFPCSPSCSLHPAPPPPASVRPPRSPFPAPHTIPSASLAFVYSVNKHLSTRDVPGADRGDRTLSITFSGGGGEWDKACGSGNLRAESPRSLPSSPPVEGSRIPGPQAPCRTLL